LSPRRQIEIAGETGKEVEEARSNAEGVERERCSHSGKAPPLPRIFFNVPNGVLKLSSASFYAVSAEIARNNSIYLGKSNQVARKGTGPSKLATQKSNKENTIHAQKNIQKRNMLSIST